MIHISGYAGRAEIPPLKIDTLYGDADRKSCVHLSWVIPLNVTAGAQYEVRCSSQNITSEQGWTEATKILQKKYTGKGGETQQEKICNLGKGTFCFAVKSIGRQGFPSDISNNYRIVIR